MKVEYESYSESDITDEPDYIPDDKPLKETDEEDLAKIEDKNIRYIKVHQIETAMKQISDGMWQAAEGYNSLRKCLPMMMSEEITGVVQQTPMLSLQHIQEFKRLWKLMEKPICWHFW